MFVIALVGMLFQSVASGLGLFLLMGVAGAVVAAVAIAAITSMFFRKAPEASA